MDLYVSIVLGVVIAFIVFLQVYDRRQEKKPMGEVVPLKIYECTCGWKVPLNVSVFGLLYPPITVAYDCPDCGKSFEQHVVSKVSQET